MGTIYIIRNTINNCVYVGKTERSCKRRWLEHKRAINDPTKESFLHRAMKKYGVENFYMEVLEDGVPSDIMSERERYYIKKYDSFNNGYNLTVGGEGESQVDHELIVAIFDRGYSCKAVSILTGYSYNTVKHHVICEKGKSHEMHISPTYKADSNLVVGKAIKYNGRSFETQKSLAEYLIQNEDLFKGKLVVTVMNYISLHRKGDEFVPTDVLKNGTRKGMKLENHFKRSVSFNGKAYSSYKELAKYLIENFEEFKNSRINTVIQGISYSVKEGKPYKKLCFY